MFTAYGVPAFVTPPPFAPFACGHASRGNDQHLLQRLCPAESMVTGGADLGSTPSGIPSVSPCSTPCHGELEVESTIGVAGQRCPWEQGRAGCDGTRGRSCFDGVS